MNTSPATPVPPKRRRRWRLVAVLLVLGALLGWGVYEWIDPNAHYIVEGRRDSNRRRVVEYGWVFGQAYIPIRDSTEVVFPTSFETPRSGRLYEQTCLNVTHRPDGKRGEVQILLKQRSAFGGHPPNSIRLRDEHVGDRVWTRRSDEKLVIALRPGWRFFEGDYGLSIIVRTPPGHTVRQEPATSPVFAGCDVDPLMTHLFEERARAAGWELIPSRPLAWSRYR